MASEKNVKKNASDAVADEAVQAEIEKILADARKTAEEIVESAKAEAKAIVKADSAKVADEDRERGEELVEVMLFRDNGKYSDDVFVSVGGENCVIQRGEPVMIKRKFKEVLDNSMAQDLVSANMQNKLAAEYERKQKEME